MRAALVLLALVALAFAAQGAPEPYVLVEGSFQPIDAQRFEVVARVTSPDLDAIDFTLVTEGTRVIEERVIVGDELNRTTEEVRGATRRVTMTDGHGEQRWWITLPTGFWSARFVAADNLSIGASPIHAWRGVQWLHDPAVTPAASARLAEPDLARVEVTFEPAATWARDALISAWAQPALQPDLRAATERALDAPLVVEAPLQDGGRLIVVTESSAKAVAGNDSWGLAVRTHAFVFERHGEDLRLVDEYEADAMTGLRPRGFEEGANTPGAPLALVLALVGLAALARRR